MNRVRVKICGVTTPNDATFAIDAGADAVGLNFYSKSPRFVTAEQAEQIVRGLPPLAVTVGVFVGELDRQIKLTALRYRLAGVQTYGKGGSGDRYRSSAYIPAFRVRDTADLVDVATVAAVERPAAVLLDSFVAGEMGGTGHRAPWHLLAGFDPGVPVILAGGLTPENVAEAIRVVRPWGVDVASGVESSPGVKDPAKVVAFIRAVRGASS